MKILLAIITVLIAACAPPKLHPLEWVPNHYALCAIHAVPGLPGDLAIQVNRTNLPFGRYDGFGSGRPHIVRPDGTSQDVGSNIIDKYGQDAVSAANWSPDGSKLYINKRWEDPSWAMQEIFDGELEFDTQHYASDIFEYDLKANTFTNLTEPERVSVSNAGLFPYAGKLAFGAILHGANTIWSMDYDGTNKQPISDTSGFSYGFNASPDGKHQAYHSNYQIYIDNIHISSPYAFNFGPTWSPDSKKVAFYCGDNEVSADLCTYDGTRVTKIASRMGFDGTVQYIEGYDFHNGGSDVISWALDSNSIYYAAGSGITEIYKASLDGIIIQITDNKGQSNYPALSADGRYLAYTLAQGVTRNLYLLDLQTSQNSQLTNVDEHCTIRYPIWRPL